MTSSYKFLITAKLIPPKKYKEFLLENETVAGLPTRFEILIKNIGKNEFPGGRFANDKGTFETSFAMTDVSVSFQIRPKKIDALKPGESLTIEGSWNPSMPGPWRLVVNIEATDKAKIQYHQSPGSSPSAAGYSFLYVVDRHQLDLALLLKRLLKKR